MDKEQAIDLLDNLIGMIEDNQDNDYDTAFRMAIEALKAQLFLEGTTSDLISRTETVEHLRRVLGATVPITDYDDGFVDGVEFGVSTVSTMPPIQSEPAIPITWIEGQIERLNNTDNYFAELTANIIKTMLNEWRKGEPNE